MSNWQQIQFSAPVKRVCVKVKNRISITEKLINRSLTGQRLGLVIHMCCSIEAGKRNYKDCIENVFIREIEWLCVFVKHFSVSLCWHCNIQGRYVPRLHICWDMTIRQSSKHMSRVARTSNGWTNLFLYTLSLSHQFLRHTRPHGGTLGAKMADSAHIFLG